MLRDAINEFRAQGFVPVILSTGDRIGDFATAFQERGAEVHHVPFRKSPMFALEFAGLVRSTGADVVHLHTERANFALGVMVRLTRKRALRTVHSVFSYTGVLRTARTLERALLRAFGVVHVAIGPSVERNELTRLRNPTTRVDNWIGARFRPPSDEERARSRTEFGVGAEQLVLTTVGNCSRVKNHEALLRALPAVARSVQRSIVYLHAGTGADEANERSLADSMGSDLIDVRFLGTVSDVLPLLWASDVFCMPSLYEGAPIAALEALACGVPAVLADVDGLRDVHPPGPSVVFVAPRPECIAEAIGSLLNDGALPRSTAKAVSENTRLSRRMGPQVERYCSIYRAGMAHDGRVS